MLTKSTRSLRPIQILIALCSLTPGPAAAADTIAPTAALDLPATLQAGTALQLSGARSSDVGGRIVHYQWTHLEGAGGNMPLNQPVVTNVSGFLVPQPTGNALSLGRHRFRLVVVDDSGNQSLPHEGAVIVLDNFPPTAALAVPAQAVQGHAFQLSGTQSSDAGGRIVRYRWTRIAGGSGGPMALNQPVETVESSFGVQQTATNPLAAGSHTFRLVVVDDSGNQSQPADAVVSVRAADNAAPIAVLELPARIQPGSALQLSGARSSDVGGRIVHYRWTRIEGAGGAMPLNQPVETEASGFLVPQPAGNSLALGRHRFRLVAVDDSANQSPPVEGAVIVQDTLPPTAVLAAPAQVAQGRAFPLSGANSTDAGGRVASYRWSRISGGSGGTMPLNQPVETVESSFVVPQTLAHPLAAGTHTFRLVVIDDSGNQSQPSDVAVHVQPTPQ